MSNKISLIAQKANVSTATVSRVFSGKDYVKEDTRKRVLEIAQKLDYKPKQYKKAKARTIYRNTVVVMLPELDNSFYYQIVQGILNVLRANKIDVLICTSNNDFGEELHLLSLCQQMQISGLIITPVSSTEEANTAMLKEMNLHIPIVLLDRDLKGVDMDGVFMNNYNSSYRGVQLLFESGHKNIAFISGPKTSTSAMQRLDGFTDAMRHNNLSVNPEHILNGNFDMHTSYQAVKDLVKYRKNLPVTAIFSSSSKMALGCLMALSEAGISVPNDIALLSFGRDELSKQNISCLHYPSQAMGEECAKIIIDRMQACRRRKVPPKRVNFDTSFESCGSEIFPANRAQKDM